MTLACGATLASHTRIRLPLPILANVPQSENGLNQKIMAAASMWRFYYSIDTIKDRISSKYLSKRIVLYATLMFPKINSLLTNVVFNIWPDAIFFPLKAGPFIFFMFFIWLSKFEKIIFDVFQFKYMIVYSCKQVSIFTILSRQL